ncbi:hypothetical protein [uncultured Legionella sp.]|uniref:hypothetical protein n=1 Tax=uncultured Legionella sp. TaxID=210934 RepID=UPI00261EE85A|nr:hypothetical protein [uncultured Legionella sp.]
MLTKRERFEQWRGAKSRSEQAIFDTYVLIDDYFFSITHLTQIKSDFANSSSEHFNKLNVYGGRAFGAIMYCKFIVEDSIDLFPQSATEELELLCELRNILTEVFDNPRKNPVHNSSRMIEISRQFLTRKVEDITELEQTKVLCFALYFILTLIYVGIDGLSEWKRLAISAFVDLDKIKGNTRQLLTLAEEKNHLLDVALAEKKLKESQTPHEITTQDYFNERITELFSQKETEERLFIKLRASQEDISDGLASLIAARTKLQVTIQNSQKLQAFLKTITDNEFKILDRSYFLDLIGNSRESFNLLMDLSHGLQKDQLILNINQLKNPGIIQSISSGLLYGMSWATSLMTITYRATLPQSVQYSIEKNIPPTLDSQCKAVLKVLLRECLSGLERELVDARNEINESTQQLAKKNMELKKRIDNEPEKQLIQLLQTNHLIAQALSEYRRISFNLKQKGYFLSQFKETYTVLRMFIENHDGWMVKLSNFFAQFFSFFKSDTAQLVDRARDLNKKLVAFESDYRKEVSKGLQCILSNPDLSRVIKDKFKEEFVTSRDKRVHGVVRATQNKEEIRELIYNTHLFFKPLETELFMDKRLRAGRRAMEFSSSVDINAPQTLCAMGIR